jgi:hypothetical protein
MVAGSKPVMMPRWNGPVPPEHLVAIIDDRWAQLHVGLKENEYGTWVEDGTSELSRRLYDTLREMSALMVQGLSETFPDGSGDEEAVMQERLSFELGQMIEARIKAFAIEVETFRVQADGKAAAS